MPDLVSPELSGLNGYLLRLARADGGLDRATSFDGLEATDPVALATSRGVAHVSIHATSAVVLGRDQAPDPDRGRAGEQTIAGGGPPDAVVAAGEFGGVAVIDGAGGIEARRVDAREGVDGIVVRWMP